MLHVVKELKVSERRACKVLGQYRSTQRHMPTEPEDEKRLIDRVTKIACEFGRYGYRRVTTILREEGWQVNVKRVHRIWREEGLKVPKKQRKRARLWLTDGSTVRLKPEHRDHVWSYDFVMERTRDGRMLKILNIVDDYTRECLAIEVRRRFTSLDVIEVLTKLFVERRCPRFIRSDNGPEFIAKALRRWFALLEVKPMYIQPGSPWENGYVESFNSRLRDEFLNGEIFYTLLEARVLLERWREYYNKKRPHSSLGYKPPAPETIVPPKVAA